MIAIQVHSKDVAKRGTTMKGRLRSVSISFPSNDKRGAPKDPQHCDHDSARVGQMLRSGNLPGNEHNGNVEGTGSAISPR